MNWYKIAYQINKAYVLANGKAYDASQKDIKSEYFNLIYSRALAQLAVSAVKVLKDKREKVIEAGIKPEEIDAVTESNFGKILGPIRDNAPLIFSTIVGEIYEISGEVPASIAVKEKIPDIEMGYGPGIKWITDQGWTVLKGNKIYLGFNESKLNALSLANLALSAAAIRSIPDHPEKFDILTGLSGVAVRDVPIEMIENKQIVYTIFNFTKKINKLS